jgi:putative endonuclease
MYYVYILHCKDKSLYTGITIDVERRFKEHCAGAGGHYTRSHKPEKIIYREKAATRSDALKREAEIKSWPREKKMRLVQKRAFTNSSMPLPVFEE